MDTVIKQISIDLYSPTFYEVIKAQQGDKNSRSVEFILYNQGELYSIPDGIKIKLEGQRGDKSSIVKDCTYSDNVVTVILDEDLLYYSGICKLKIVLYDLDESTILSTIPFTLSVQKNPLNNDEFEKNNYSLLNKLILKEEENEKKISELSQTVEELKELINNKN